MSKYSIVRSDEEIITVLRALADAFEGGSYYPGMPYEEGAQNMFDWLTGITNDVPC